MVKNLDNELKFGMWIDCTKIYHIYSVFLRNLKILNLYRFFQKKVIFEKFSKKTQNFEKSEIAILKIRLIQAFSLFSFANCLKT